VLWVFDREKLRVDRGEGFEPGSWRCKTNLARGSIRQTLDNSYPAKNVTIMFEMFICAHACNERADEALWLNYDLCSYCIIIIIIVCLYVACMFNFIGKRSAANVLVDWEIFTQRYWRRTTNLDGCFWSVWHYGSCSFNLRDSWCNINRFSVLCAVILRCWHLSDNYYSLHYSELW